MCPAILVSSGLVSKLCVFVCQLGDCFSAWSNYVLGGNLILMLDITDVLSSFVVVPFTDRHFTAVLPTSEIGKRLVQHSSSLQS